MTQVTVLPVAPCADSQQVPSTVVSETGKVCLSCSGAHHGACGQYMIAVECCLALKVKKSAAGCGLPLSSRSCDCQT